MAAFVHSVMFLPLLVFHPGIGHLRVLVQLLHLIQRLDLIARGRLDGDMPVFRLLVYLVQAHSSSFPSRYSSPPKRGMSSSSRYPAWGRRTSVNSSSSRQSL